MIYYATQETMDRYKLKRPHEMSPGIKELWVLSSIFRKIETDKTEII